MPEYGHRHYTVRTTSSYWLRWVYERGDRTMPENVRRQYAVQPTRFDWPRGLYKRGDRTMPEDIHTPDVANIHTCATCGKTFGLKYDLRRHKNTVHFEDVSSGDEDLRSEDSESENKERPEVETSESETSSDDDNEIYQRWYERSMQVSEPARTKKYENTWAQVWRNSGLERKPLKEPCGRLKATFSTPTRNSCW